MKVTKSYLKRIIKEELSIVLEGADVNQAIESIPISLPRGIEVKLDVGNKSVVRSNVQGVKRFDDAVMMAYLVADKSLNPKERAQKLVMKLLSTAVGSQIFFDRLDDQQKGRISNIVNVIAREKGLESGMNVMLVKGDQDAGGFQMRSMDDYNQMTQAIQGAQK